MKNKVTTPVVDNVPLVDTNTQKNVKIKGFEDDNVSEWVR